MVLNKHGVHRGHEGLNELAQPLGEEMPYTCSAKSWAAATPT